MSRLRVALVAVVLSACSPGHVDDDEDDGDPGDSGDFAIEDVVDPGAACLEYVAAVLACLDTFEVTSGLPDDSFCDAYASLSGSEAEEADAYLTCLAEVYDAADCSTLDGVTEASEDALACLES